MMKRIIFIMGPSCVGKSTIIKMGSSTYTDSVRISADQIRGSMHFYDAEKAHHREWRDKMFDFLFALFVDGGVSFFFCEVPRSLAPIILEYAESAKGKGYEVSFIFLTATEETLGARFEERNKFMAERGKIPALTSRTAFLDAVSGYVGILNILEYKIQSAGYSLMKLSTDVVSPEATFSEIVKICGTPS